MTPALPIAALTLAGVSNPFDPSLGQDLANAASGNSQQSAGTTIEESYVTTPTHEVGGQTGLLRPARIAAFAVGILLIAGGIFALKPVRETVRKGVETGRKVATVAAEAAA